MNILMVHNFYKIPGGEDTVMQNEMKLLQDHGNKVVLYKRSNDELDSYRGIRKIMLPFHIVFSAQVYYELKELIWREKIDIVHIHNTVCMVSPSAYYAAFALRIPVVQTIHNFRLLCVGATFFRNGRVCEECIRSGIFHGCKYNCYRDSKLSTIALALMTALHKVIGTYQKVNFICLTDFNRMKLLKINQKGKKYINPNKVFVKPNFTVDRHSVISWSKRENQIVYAGRIDKTKGMEILLRAWTKIPHIKLVICGTGPEDEWCNNYIEINNLDNVEIKGFVPHDHVMEIIAHSKALILPTQWYEGFPMVLVESFACGTPVLGSNMGNVGGLIKSGINGLKFDQTSAESIVETVNMLTDMVDSTIAVSNSLYSKNNNYSMLMKIYTDICDTTDINCGVKA